MHLSGKFLRGALLGAAAMYWLDPVSGRRRRALTRQRFTHAAHQAVDETEVMARDLAHRARGIVRGARARLRPSPVDDTVLEERVRAKLGRVCSHPSSVEVVCHAGWVELTGPILRGEEERVIRAIKHVPGVREVVSRLDVHDRAEGIPGLQGGRPRPGDRLDLFQRTWAPATQALVGATGAALLWRGVRHRGPGGLASSVAGLTLVARSISSGRRITALEQHKRGVSVRKTINVDAPVEEVYALWNSFESFPRFMSHVKAVERIGEDAYHWRVTGPLGITVAWDAEITERIANELIAWRSVDSALVENAGRVHFTPNRHGGTQIDVQLAYHPPTGYIGHALASLLGASPKKQMDDDLVRFKSLVEEGKATGRQETVTREEIGATLR
jgi:uncharacterized membrane protein